MQAIIIKLFFGSKTEKLEMSKNQLEREIISGALEKEEKEKLIISKEKVLNQMKVCLIKFLEIFPNILNLTRIF